MGRSEYYRQMRELAGQTRAHYGLTTPRVLRSDMRRIYRDQGIHIDLWPHRMKKVRGAYFDDDLGPTVMLVKGLPADPMVFTMAHEMGHSLHTILSHETQPFIYSSYTIFVAEVPSTLSEALLLDYMLERSTDPVERIVLLQHAIDNITSTFFTQVMFADFELRAHRLAEEDKPITSEILTELYSSLLKSYYGDAVDLNDLTGVTWARIPHFFNSPYYVYQYATCFASAAKLARELTSGDEAPQQAARQRYIELLRSGGSDHPMELLKRAGVDLTKPDTVRAIIEQLEDLVTRLEAELESVAT